MNREKSFFENFDQAEDNSDDPYKERRRADARGKRQTAENVKRLSDEAQRELNRSKIADETLARLKKLPPNPKFTKE